MVKHKLGLMRLYLNPCRSLGTENRFLVFCMIYFQFSSPHSCWSLSKSSCPPMIDLFPPQAASGFTSPLWKIMQQKNTFMFSPTPTGVVSLTDADSNVFHWFVDVSVMCLVHNPGFCHQYRGLDSMLLCTFCFNLSTLLFLLFSLFCVHFFKLWFFPRFFVCLWPIGGDYFLQRNVFLQQQKSLCVTFPPSFLPLLCFSSSSEFLWMMSPWWHPLLLVWWWYQERQLVVCESSLLHFYPFVSTLRCPEACCEM